MLCLLQHWMISTMHLSVCFKKFNTLFFFVLIFLNARKSGETIVKILLVWREYILLGIVIQLGNNMILGNSARISFLLFFFFPGSFSFIPNYCRVSINHWDSRSWGSTLCFTQKLFGKTGRVLGGFLLRFTSVASGRFFLSRCFLPGAFEHNKNFN